MLDRSSSRPSQGQLTFPLLETISKLGGKASASDVAESLAEQFAISTEAASEVVVTNDGQRVNLWRRHVRFARQKAKALGYIAAGRRGGLWELTDEGYVCLDHATPAFLVEIVTDSHGIAIGARINLSVGIPTTHLIATGDARNMSWIESGAIPLIVTSVPYFDIKDYGKDHGQLANASSYETFLE